MWEDDEPIDVALIDDPPDLDLDPDAEILKCSLDCAYFTDQYGIIDDSQGHGDEPTGVMPFKLWPAQIALIWALMTTRLLILLKARQLGMSWAVCSYVLWRCLFRPMQVILLISKGQLEANELLRRIKALHQRLPEWLRERLPQIDPAKDNASEVLFTNGSVIHSLPATRNAGISFTASVVVMDEAAHMTYGTEIYSSVKPTIDAGGSAQLILLSTANGLGGLFHTIWSLAVEGANAFKAVFLAWWERPDRGAGWREERRKEAVDPKLITQEYPENAVEAFLASGNTRFEPEWIAEQAKNLRPPLPLDMLPDEIRDIPGLKVWKLPEPDEEYVFGGDVSEGLEHGDYDACPVLSISRWEQVAELHGHFEPDEYAGYLIRLANFYNMAEVGPERNNHGHAVLTAFAMARDPDTELPMPFERVALGHDGKQGWLTNVKTKGPMIDLIAAALRDNCIIIRSAGLLSELQVYRKLKRGKLGAPPGYFDDRVMGLAICLALIQQRYLNRSQGPPEAGGTERKRMTNFVGARE